MASINGITGEITSFTPPSRFKSGKMGPSEFWINGEPRGYSLWTVPDGLGMGSTVMFDAGSKPHFKNPREEVWTAYDLKVLSQGTPVAQPSPSGAVIGAYDKPQAQNTPAPPPRGMMECNAMNNAVTFVNQQALIDGNPAQATSVGMAYAYFLSILTGKTQEVEAPKGDPLGPNDPVSDIGVSTAANPVPFS